MPKEQYMCQLCANHGVFNQPKKGHKQKCPHRECPCSLCALNTKRRALDQMERQLKTTANGAGQDTTPERVPSTSSANPASASSSPLGQPILFPGPACGPIAFPANIPETSGSLLNDSLLAAAFASGHTVHRPFFPALPFTFTTGGLLTPIASGAFPPLRPCVSEECDRASTASRHYASSSSNSSPTSAASSDSSPATAAVAAVGKSGGAGGKASTQRRSWPHSSSSSAPFAVALPATVSRRAMRARLAKADRGRTLSVAIDHIIEQRQQQHERPAAGGSSSIFRSAEQLAS